MEWAHPGINVRESARAVAASADRAVRETLVIFQDERSGGSDAAQDAPAEQGRRPRRRRGLRLWQETALLLALALVLALVIKTFFLQAFYIPSESMEPGLVENGRILVEKWSYWGDASPERGDVVVFRLPKDTSTDYIKRVIGLPGDKIQVIDGIVHINGDPVKREAAPDFVDVEEGIRQERRQVK